MTKRFVTYVFEISEGDDLGDLPKIALEKTEGVPRVISSSRADEIARVEAIEVINQSDYLDVYDQNRAISELLAVEDNFDLVVQSWD